MAKRKLNTKRFLLLIIFVVIFVFLVGISVSERTREEERYLVLFSCAIGITFTATGIVVICLAEAIRKERKKQEIQNKKNLSYTDFKQVYFFLGQTYGSHIDMMSQILQKEECKFYTKLETNNNILLLVKDKHNEEVYKKEIGNYSYFYSHFKFEK